MIMKFNYSDGGRSKYFKGKVGDCVCRAICNATGKDYKEVYDLISDTAKDMKLYEHSARNGVNPKVTREVLKRLGFTWHAVVSIGTGCKMRLTETEVPSGICILRLSKHLTCIKNKELYDTYDCSRENTRCVYGYWRKE